MQFTVQIINAPVFFIRAYFGACKTLSVALLLSLLSIPLVYANTHETKINPATQDLFSAVQVNDLESVKTAITSGADIATKNEQGQTAADIAVEKGHFIIANYLLSQPRIKKVAKPKPAIKAEKQVVQKSKTKKPHLKTATSQKPSGQFPTPKSKPRIGQKKLLKQQQPSQTAELSGALTPPAQQIIIQPVKKPIVKKTSEKQQTAQAVIPPEPTTKTQLAAKPAAKPAEKSSAIGQFFTSLVDLITPEQNTVQKTPPIIPDEVVIIEDPKVVNPTPSQINQTVQNGTEAGISEVPQTAIPPVVPDGFELTEQQPPQVSDTASRTLKRINNLLDNRVEEDEFGLPIDDSNTTGKKTAGKTRAQNRPNMVLPETDYVEIIDGKPNAERPTIQQSDGAPLTIEQRLSKIQRVLNRNITVDTKKILQQNREMIRERAPELYTPRQKRNVTVLPQKPLNQRSDPKSRLENRLARQVERIRRQETPIIEDANGLPEMTASGSPEIGPDDDPDNDNPEQSTPKEAPSLIDRVAKLFSSNKDPLRKNVAPRPDNNVEIVGGYKRAPSQQPPTSIDKDRSGTSRFTPPKAMVYKTDDPETGVKSGRLSPQLLDKIANLLETDDRYDKSNWSADIEVVNPELGNVDAQTAANAASVQTPAPTQETPDTWTTVVEQSPGDGEAPVVVKRIETTVPQDPPLQTSTNAFAQNLPAAANNYLIDVDMAVKDLSGELPPISTVPVIENRAVAASEPIAPSANSQLATVDAETLYTDPLRQLKKRPQPPEKPKQFFSRLSGLFQSPSKKRTSEEPLALEPTEKLASAVIAKTNKQGGGVPSVWPVVNVKLSNVEAINSTPPGVLQRTSLEGVTFSLGQSVNLENSLPPGDDGSDPNNQCVKKNRGTTLFCIEPIDWPEELQKNFIIPTILYTGPMAIVRYDQGSASRLHALFKSEKFENVAKYYESRFGEPTEIWKRSIAPLAKPRQENPTLSWRSRDPETNAVSILEIRQFDDTRGGFPDTKRGAVMLYFANSPKIFPQVSSNELMRIQRASNETKTEENLKSDQTEPTDNTNPAKSATLEAPADDIFPEDDLSKPLDDELDATFDEELNDSLDDGPDSSLDGGIDQPLDEELNNSLDDSPDTTLDSENDNGFDEELDRLLDEEDALEESQSKLLKNGGNSATGDLGPLPLTNN